MIKGCAAMKMASSAPLCQTHGPYVRRGRMAGPVQSITRAEIDSFWSRKKLEEEERWLDDEKEAARIKLKTLKQEEYTLFEQRINRIIDEKTEPGEMMEEGEIAENIEIQIGIKHWWRKSSCAYLNEPAVASIDDNRSWKKNTGYIPQKIHFRCSPPAVYQMNVTAFGVF
ncbi:hypothetical protein ACQJBY_055035 [Aegilops geniculata]